MHVPRPARRPEAEGVRGQQVMLDSDPAELYGVETRALNRAAKRNEDRFPEDFRFKLTRGGELDLPRCRIGTLAGRDTDSSIGRTYFPHVYTEQVVAALGRAPQQGRN
ncbi:ORF6N domain-containing protein [Hugonella massiliensis]|uniref:ORF6N domain-containing protein n=1 Tax=Hugonella massiliensis TaxID=1720315 RepID=UPI0038BC166A